MKRIEVLALIAMLIGPIYQIATANKNNDKDFIVGNIIVESDQSRIMYGNNILKNILGVKTIDKIYNGNSLGGASEISCTTITTPIWMQKIGCCEEVSWGSGFVHQSSVVQDVYVVVVRLLVKLVIAVFFLIIFLLTSVTIDAVDKRRGLRGSVII